MDFMKRLLATLARALFWTVGFGDADRGRRLASNLAVIVTLAAGLGVWIALPWYGVLGVAVVLALWLLLTRSGRLALAATHIGIASLPQRWGASSVIVIGIAGVVAVLVAMLSMGRGFQATMNSTRRLNLTQEELGQLVGLSRQTVNKVLRSLEGMSIVSLDFGRVAIVDDEALNAYLAATAAH